MPVEIHTLLERDTAGLHVEVRYVSNGTLLLFVARNGHAASTTIPQDRAKDAFEHPVLYLDDAAVTALFGARP